MNMSNNFCSKLQLVKPPGRLIGTHYRREALYNWLVELKITCGMKSIARPILETCTIYTVNPANIRPPGPPDKTCSDRGIYPREDWQIDLTVMPTAQGNFKYP